MSGARFSSIPAWIAVAASAALLCTQAQDRAVAATTGYVANSGVSSVTVFDPQTNMTVGAPIEVGPTPILIAITPDGRFAYVSVQGSDTVAVIDTQTNTTVGSPIGVGTFPTGIAITPDGSRVYVTNAVSASVSVIDTQSNTTVGAPIPVGSNPTAVAITPDGQRAYVANEGPDTISVIDTSTNSVLGMPIPVGLNPRGLAVSPDGRRVFISEGGSHTVSILDTQTNSLVGSIPVGMGPRGIAITPDGRFAYVVNGTDDTTSVIDTQTNTIVAAPIMVGDNPRGIAITPNGLRAFAANFGPDTLSVIDIATNAIAVGPLSVGANPQGMAFVPNQPPVASFTTSPEQARAGRVHLFNGAASTDSDGQVVRFDWDFGDGTAIADGGPNPTHTFVEPGTYTVRLTATDNEGCSTAMVYTGQTAYCNGSGIATTMQLLTVVDPTDPRFSLAGKKIQRLHAAVDVIAKGASESVDFTATGSLKVGAGGSGKAALKRFKLRKASAEVGAGGRAKLKLRIPRGAGRAAAKALDGGGTAQAKISVKADDTAGNSTRRKRTIRIVSGRP